MKLSDEEIKKYLNEILTVRVDLDVIDSATDSVMKSIVKTIPSAFLIVTLITHKLADVMSGFPAPMRFAAIGALMRAEIMLLKKHLDDVEGEVKSGEIELD